MRLLFVLLELLFEFGKIAVFELRGLFIFAVLFGELNVAVELFDLLAQLLDALWDNKGQYVEDNTLSVTMKRLREKIEADPQNPVLITTIRGLGYRMEPLRES